MGVRTELHAGSVPSTLHTLCHQVPCAPEARCIVPLLLLLLLLTLSHQANSFYPHCVLVSFKL